MLNYVGALLAVMVYIFFGTAVLGVLFKLTTGDILRPRWWSLPLYMAVMVPAVIGAVGGAGFLLYYLSLII